MNKVCWLLCVFVALLLPVAGLAPAAQAQSAVLSADDIDYSRDEDSVTGRSRPEYDPQGIPVGAFRAYPSVGVTASYDDNVLRTPSDGKTDYFFSFAPDLNLVSQWSRHYLALHAGANRFQYSNLSSEDRTEWDVSAVGRLDIISGVGLSANLAKASTFESRTSRDQIGAAGPTPYQRSDARFIFSYDPYRFGVQVTGEFERYNYDETKLLPSFGGGVLNNDDRDRDVYQIQAKALYEFSPGYALFVRPGYRKVTYDLQTGRAAGRDSEGYTMDGGINLLLGQLVKGEIYFGYINQNLQGQEFQDLSGINYGAALRWYPTELITVRLDASRTPNVTTIVGASFSDERNVGVGIDYEARRNIIIQTDLTYTDTTLDGTTRRDEDFSARFGVRYLLNPYLVADTAFTRSVRNSTATGRGFSDDVVSFTLTAHI